MGAADNMVDHLEEMGVRVKKLGIGRVAERAGLKERVVRKFTVDVLASKGGDITKISNAVKALEAEEG